MRSDELETAIRIQGGFGTAAQFSDLSATRLRGQATQSLWDVFSPLVTRGGGQYWHQRLYTALVAGQVEYPMPPRASGGVIIRIELVNTDGTLTQLHSPDETFSADFTQPVTTRGAPQRYIVRGDQWQVIPTPDKAYPIVVHYFIRPNQLVQSQSSEFGGDGIVRGLVTSITNIASRQITVNALPFDQLLASPAAIQTGNQQLDIVHPDGWHELALCNARQTFSGLVITLGPNGINGENEPLNHIRLGDFVRVAGQTDWPCLPVEYHDTLAQVAASVVCNQTGNEQKARSLAELAGGGIGRFDLLTTPRVKSEAAILAAPPWVSGDYGMAWPL